MKIQKRKKKYFLLNDFRYDQLNNFIIDERRYGFQFLYSHLNVVVAISQ